MTILSQKITQTVCRKYERAFNIKPYFINVSGERLPGNYGPVQAYLQTHAYALQEAVRWGEPFVFYPFRGVVSWIVALVEQRRLHGGLIGGEVRTPGAEPQEIIKDLIEQGLDTNAASLFCGRLPEWPAEKIKGAALSLNEIFYQASGWNPVLLEENRIKAIQQRHIAEAMDAQKKNSQGGYPIDKEKMLLSLIRAGDQNGARRVLNEMLGAMYLFSTKLAVLRARAIELMGYLTRTAVEDSPILEPLIERNHKWMQKLIVAPDFETLSHVLMQALDDFMHGIYARGFNCYHPHVGRILDHIASHYSEPLSMREISGAAGISVSRVAHLVRQHTGKTVWQHIMRMRINRARQLLEGTNESCSEIALKTGFCDQSYFTKHFRRLTGTSPAHYRRSLAGSVPR